MDDRTLTQWLRALAQEDRAEWEQLMQAAHQLAIKEREERLGQEHASCLSLLRARALVLNPARWTEDERMHVAACRRCAHLVESFERNMTHPSVWALLLWLLGRLTDEEAQAMRYHIEDGECQRCRRLIQSPWLSTLAEAVKAGQRTMAQLEAVLEAQPSVVSNVAPLLALVPQFAPEIRPPFQVRAESPDGSLTVTVCETDEGELVAYAETSNRELLGRTVHVELLGESQTLTAEVTFDFQHEQGCFGQHSFGSFAELAPHLGSNCQVFAVLTE